MKTIHIPLIAVAIAAGAVIWYIWQHNARNKGGH